MIFMYWTFLPIFSINFSLFCLSGDKCWKNCEKLGKTMQIKVFWNKKNQRVRKSFCFSVREMWNVQQWCMVGNSCLPLFVSFLFLWRGTPSLVEEMEQVTRRIQNHWFSKKIIKFPIIPHLPTRIIQNFNLILQYLSLKILIKIQTRVESSMPPKSFQQNKSL